MANNDSSQRKCVTFTWKLENARFCWQKNIECEQSPTFVVDETQESLWSLNLYPRYLERDVVALYLRRHPAKNGSKEKIDYEIAFLAQNGTVFLSEIGTNKTFDKGFKKSHGLYAKRDDIFPAKSSFFRQRDTITARCKIWKRVGEISEDTQYLARTRIGVEKISSRWNIENFRNYLIKGYTVKSPKNNKKLICIHLIQKPDQTFHFFIKLLDETIKYSTFHFSAVDVSGNKVEALRDEIRHNMPFKIKPCNLFFETKLKENNVNFPNDVLTLRCQFAISFGVTMKEIESRSSNCTDSENDELGNRCLVSENAFSVSKSVLNESLKPVLAQGNDFSFINNLQSMVNNGSLFDIKLRTSSQIFPAHKFILSARCPKFKAMFSSDAQQETDDFVDIKGLDDDTVPRILRYIYSSEVEQLEWSSATKLYVGADDFQILALKDICSAYLKSSLSLTNACEGLVLADKQKDQNLKEFVQKYILEHGKCIINSADWKCLMKTNLPLAAETMFLKFEK